MNQPSKSFRRKRGVILNAWGLRRLRQAINRAEAIDNQGERYSADTLSELTGVSKSTISRLWASKSGVDQKSLRLVFSTFGLNLTQNDLLPADASQTLSDPTAELNTLPSQDVLPYPSGPVPLGSPLYIARPPLEQRAVSEISQPGCVVRIKAPSGFGKSSLLLRVLTQAEILGYAIASIDLKQAEPSILGNANAFLRWFCRAIAFKLGNGSSLEEHWSDMLGHSLSTTLFFREQILEPSPVPVVLNIEEFNLLFAYPATSQAFLPLLRSWYEEARQGAVWQKLRQVVSYATESYLPLDINKSPFNVGLPINLPEFTPEQVNILAQRHQLNWTAAESQRLMTLVGGHPTLVRIALYYLSQDDLTLDQLIDEAASNSSVFHSYLQELLIWVRAVPKQLERLESLVMSQGPMPLDPVAAYQLEAIGLIKSTADGWVIGLSLYREYFRNALLLPNE